MIDGPRWVFTFAYAAAKTDELKKHRSPTPSLMYLANMRFSLADDLILAKLCND